MRNSHCERRRNHARPSVRNANATSNLKLNSSRHTIAMPVSAYLKLLIRSDEELPLRETEEPRQAEREECQRDVESEIEFLAPHDRDAGERVLETLDRK